MNTNTTANRNHNFEYGPISANTRSRNNDQDFAQINYAGSQLNISYRQYVREKKRKRTQQTRLNQTQEQHETNKRQMRFSWNTHAHTADNVTVGQEYDVRRRQRVNAQTDLSLPGEFEKSLKDITPNHMSTTWYDSNRQTLYT